MTTTLHHMLNRPLRIAAAVVLAATAFGLPANTNVTAAHPLGNFSVNRYTRIELTGGSAQIHYVLDMAEIPTFLELSLIDTDQDGTLSESERQRYGADKAEHIRAELALTVDGQALPLTVGPTRTATLQGQGGLETLRFEALFTAQHTAAVWNVQFADNNEPSRPGWREIVVQAGAGATLSGSAVPQADLSAALTKYPDSETANPLNVREAQFTVAFAAGSSVPQGQLPALSITPVDRNAGTLPAGLALSTDMTAGAMLLALLAAVAFGAVHALSPGHGKSVVAAYLVGSRGTVRQAMFLGLTVTVTHTIGVYALGVVTLVASAWVLPHQLYPVLGLASGLMVLVVGLSLLRSRLGSALDRRGGRHDAGEHHHGHSHEAGHDHQDHAHTAGDHTHGHRHAAAHDHNAHTHSHDGGTPHSHLPLRSDGTTLGMRGLLALGVSGGLVPCPSALVLMLSAIALHQVGLGLVLIVAFSLGLAGVITGMGVALVLSRDRVSSLRLALPDRLVQPLLRTVPVAAALVVVVIGVVMTVRGVSGL